jgi:hypothetical protein
MAETDLAAFVQSDARLLRFGTIERSAVASPRERFENSGSSPGVSIGVSQGPT